MTITYTWSVEARTPRDVHDTLTVNGTTYHGVVHTVHWRLRAEDRDSDGKVKTATWPDGERPLRAEVYGTINLDTSDPGADTFIDAQDLDDKTLAHWAAVAMQAQDGDEVQRIKDQLAKQIDEIANPPQVNVSVRGEVDDNEVTG
jgi:hypothetical protein